MNQHILAEINTTLQGILQELKKMNEPPKPSGNVQPAKPKEKKHKAYK